MASQKFLVDLDLQGQKISDFVLGTTAGTDHGAIWFDAINGLVKFVDATGTVQSIAPKSYVDAEVAAEAADRASEISRVEDLISDEEAARILADQQLAADLATETSNRQSAVSNVAADLATETSARQSADAALQQTINTMLANNQAYAAGVSAAFNADRARLSALEAADITLDSRLDAHDGDISDIQGQLAALDTTYATDASVTSAVAAEETRAMGVEAQLQSDLTAAENDIVQLGQDLADEVTNRQAAVSAVANDLADEVSNRQAAVTAVANDLAAEVTNRQNAVADVASDLSDEVTRATAAESGLDSRISSLEADAPSYALASSVSASFAAEETRADAYADAAALTAENNAKAYADQIAQGLNAKEGVRTVVGTGSTLSGTYTVYSPGDTNQDFGVALAVGDHVIVTDPDGSVSGGIYTVQSGAWTLREDWDSDTTKAGAFVYVAEGLYGGTAWVSLDIANNPSSPVWFFQQISGVANVFSTDESITVGTNGDLSVSIAKLVELHSVSRKATATIGNGSSTSYTVTHSLGEDVAVSVREIATGELVQAGVVCNSTSVVVTFNDAPASNTIKVVIIG